MWRVVGEREREKERERERGREERERGGSKSIATCSQMHCK